MTANLPPNLLRLFAPRPPVPYLPPVDKGPDPRPFYMDGIGAFLERCKDHDTDYVPSESWAEQKARKVILFRLFHHLVFLLSQLMTTSNTMVMFCYALFFIILLRLPRKSNVMKNSSKMQ